MRIALKTLLAAFGLVFASAQTSVLAQETNVLLYGIKFEQFEYRWGDENERIAAWDGDAFIGIDEIKLRWRTEGEYDTRARAFEKLENGLVVQTPISTFFDVKAGVRLDTPKGADRWYGVVGIAGLAKQWFEIDADFYVSETGDTSARLDVEYELLLTNRLILEPSLDIKVAFSDDREIGVGAGFSSAEIGLRLRYDLVDRALSPYVGVVYERKLGRTADIAQDEGEDIEAWFAVIGLRMMF